MGGGSWDSGAYTRASVDRATRGIDDFSHSGAVRSGRARGIHSDLDPKKVAGPTSPLAGQHVRESRDSDEHPESLPVAMLFDVTGSMGVIPKELQKKLAQLMDVIIAKAGIQHPQILVGAIGDATCDQYPFQVGQFESDNRFDEQLRNIILEGGGGGQVMETYGLAWRFAVYHTATDAWDKRGKKGYLFTMGDEMPWPTVTAQQVSQIFGVETENDETVEELLAKVQERWEVFHLGAMDGSYPDRNDIHDRWHQLLGERYVKVEDSSLVCEVIAGLIHSLESSFEIDRVLADIGVTGKDRTVVRNALVPVVSSRVPAHLAKGGLPATHGKKTPTVTSL
ncbi:MAG: VWA domain-containing protein [Candidatus Kerfeldbacteria bacterium]|nr:VWA domain-containing protein [Candidatus Kerfeldbacteria bacterium]